MPHSIMLNSGHTLPRGAWPLLRLPATRARLTVKCADVALRYFRAARNKARKEAIADGKVKKGDSKEVDHISAPRTGPLDGVPTRVIGKTANRKRQPKRT